MITNPAYNHHFAGNSLRIIGMKPEIDFQTLLSLKPSVFIDVKVSEVTDTISSVPPRGRGWLHMCAGFHGLLHIILQYTGFIFCSINYIA